MIRIAVIIVLCLLVIATSDAYAIQNTPLRSCPSTGKVKPAEKHLHASTKQTVQPCVFTSDGVNHNNEFQASGLELDISRSTQAILWLFLQSLILGLLAVFTPYVYTIHPFTVGYLSRNAKSAKQKIVNALIYAGSLITVFTLLGILIALLIKITGLQRFADHWIFNLFFFRIFVTLGISFLGVFAIKLPASWINSMANKAEANNLKGIFFMAVTLPGASFSSTFPIVGLVLLLAGNVSIIGPVIGLFGFAIGLALPFVFPGLLNIFARSKSLLNNIKVIMGFSSLMIALKFLSKADISLGLNLLDRDLFIVIWMGLWAIMGIYMLGFVKLSHDTETEQNIYGQEYIPLSRLFIAIGAFVFALYLLPGIWGAPLHGVSGFLPQ